MTGLPQRHPIGFGLVVTVLLVVAYVVAGLVAALATTDAAGQRLVEALVRLGGAATCAWVVWRVGLSADAGLSHAGASVGWLIVGLVLVFQLPIQLFALFGRLTVPVSDWALSGAVAFNGAAAGVLEELGFRGLLLFALLRVWSDSPRGVVQSVALSSLLFGVVHFIRLAMGQPVADVSLLVLDATVSGIFYAGIVLYARSIWPAVAFHAVPNAVVGAFAVATPGFSETVAAWVPILLSEIPVVALGLYLLARTVRRGSAAT
jgi:membrane protease YdiL (CAAX protease family)